MVLARSPTARSHSARRSCCWSSVRVPAQGGGRRDASLIREFQCVRHVLWDFGKDIEGRCPELGRHLAMVQAVTAYRRARRDPSPVTKRLSQTADHLRYGHALREPR